MAFQTIQQREINVAMKLGNRQDLMAPQPGSSNTYSRIDGWLRDAYISISFSQTFEQTEETTTFKTVPGQDAYDYPDTARAIKSLVGVNQQTGAPIIVDWKDINYVRRYAQNYPGQPNQGTPSIVAPWGQGLIFRPIPDAQPYLFYLDIWEKPVIEDDVISTQLALPDDWLEVVDYDAAIRGHAELLEDDKAASKSKLLYGWTDPNTGQKVQGITDRLGTRLQAQKPWMDWGIQPKWNARYTSKR